MTKSLLHEVRFPWKSSIGDADRILVWLREQGLAPERDWEIDMHGGKQAYVSFWFRDRSHALLAKLTLGGA